MSFDLALKGFDLLTQGVALWIIKPRFPIALKGCYISPLQGCIFYVCFCTGRCPVLLY